MLWPTSLSRLLGPHHIGYVGLSWTYNIQKDESLSAGVGYEQKDLYRNLQPQCQKPFSHVARVLKISINALVVSFVYQSSHSASSSDSQLDRSLKHFFPEKYIVTYCDVNNTNEGQTAGGGAVKLALQFDFPQITILTNKLLCPYIIIQDAASRFVCSGCEEYKY